MGRQLIIVLLLALTMSGCSKFFVKDTQVQYVPVLYCPAPPEVSRPELPIHQMTPAQAKNPGEVVKHYKATVRALMGYSESLEYIIKFYSDSDKEYEELRKKLEDDINSGKYGKVEPTK